MLLLHLGRAGELVCSQMEGLLSLLDQELPAEQGRTRSDFVFSILGSRLLLLTPSGWPLHPRLEELAGIWPSLLAYLVCLFWINSGYL